MVGPPSFGYGERNGTELLVCVDARTPDVAIATAAKRECLSDELRAIRDSTTLISYNVQTSDFGTKAIGLVSTAWGLRGAMRSNEQPWGENPTSRCALAKAQFRHR